MSHYLSCAKRFVLKRMAIQLLEVTLIAILDKTPCFMGLTSLLHDRNFQPFRYLGEDVAQSRQYWAAVIVIPLNMRYRGNSKPGEK
jgi:hypothetical protein